MKQKGDNSKAHIPPSNKQTHCEVTPESPRYGSALSFLFLHSLRWRLETEPDPDIQGWTSQKSGKVAWMGITQRACETTDCWAPLPEFLIQDVQEGPRHLQFQNRSFSKDSNKPSQQAFYFIKPCPGSHIIFNLLLFSLSPYSPWHFILSEGKL